MREIETAWERTKRPSFLRKESQLNHPVRQMLLEHAAGDTVLDVGCASSIDYPMWIKAGYSYTGVDFTDKFLKHGKELYPAINQIRCDASDIPLPDESSETVYGKDLLEHQPPEKYVDVIDEMWRITSKVMMIAFYISPSDKPTSYGMVNNLHYKNHYNKKELLGKLQSLSPINVKIIENIGFNNSALYVVTKHE